MITDFFLGFFKFLLDALSSALPKLDTKDVTIPAVVTDWIPRLGYYIDLAPIVIALGLVLSTFAVMILFKLIVWIWRLIPFT